MLDREQVERLSASDLGSERYVSISTQGHGDIIILTRQGGEGQDNETGKAFGMAHGHEVNIIAALVGYLNRSGVDIREIKTIVTSFASEIIEDEGLKNQSDSGGIFFRSILDTARGRALKRFNVESQGLDCLTLPITSSPGHMTDFNPGYAFYTREEDDGELTLVLGRYNKSSEQVDQSVEFGIADVPILGGMICSIAQGQYRRDIQRFTEEVFE